ncbi:replication protein P [Marinobacter sp. ATCH36]|uniref:replication protein P n=1 Tax=Marinobacter sp. ATCH36 TaxID=2945106 RepID=UPI0020210991|nr:replication protein P [Marinobacter sp. ATCH36]MCL7944759.1 replication protein P [Marinobacter sp. ATCH36]
MQSQLKPIDAEIQMAKAVEYIFTQIKLICPGWKATWSNESVENEAKKFWLKVLLETGIRTDLEIKCGLQRTLKEGDPYCPPIGRFIRWCKPNPEVLGLPSASAAYREACQKVHPARRQCAWSHAAVFLAAQSVGAHELRILSQDKSWPMFERAYAIACDWQAPDILDT